MTTTPTVGIPFLARVPNAAWARVAGFMFLFYIANGLAGMAAGGAAGDALANLVVVDAMVLAVALFAITHKVHLWIAAVAFVLRFSEGLWGTPLASSFAFALGSTLFAWLFLRGRLVPTALAYFGLATSLLLVVALPIIGVSWEEPLTWAVWLPMLAYELALSGWLLVKGARA